MGNFKECAGCPDRVSIINEHYSFNCHMACEKYLEEKAKHDENAARIRKEKDDKNIGLSFMFEQREKAKRKMRKKG